MVTGRRVLGTLGTDIVVATKAFPWTKSSLKVAEARDTQAWLNRGVDRVRCQAPRPPPSKPRALEVPENPAQPQARAMGLGTRRPRATLAFLAISA